MPSKLSWDTHTLMHTNTHNIYGSVCDIQRRYESFSDFSLIWKYESNEKKMLLFEHENKRHGWYSSSNILISHFSSYIFYRFFSSFFAFVVVLCRIFWIDPKEREICTKDLAACHKRSLLFTPSLWPIYICEIVQARTTARDK